MSSFGSLEARRPLSFVTVPPHIFSEEWDARPKAPVAIGLRLVAEADVFVARAQARRRANEAFPNLSDSPNELPLWVDAFNDAFLAHFLAFAMCDPNDAAADWEPFRASREDMTRMFVTPDGLRLIYDAWERMRIANDPTQREATNEEISGLVELLEERSDLLGRPRAMRIRRLLAFCADELASVKPLA